MVSFTDYYRERRGFAPFPWLVRLAERFAAGNLPDVIDLPTGSGKSDVVMIWAWARTVNAPLPRRLWMVSDRRIIVDQSHRIAERLEGDGIRASRLRGGMKADPERILDPVTPQAISATVDQVGSRLLFRGYGASPSAWPIWAGLVGHDSLIVLDEAHNSPNAEDTFRACRRLGCEASVIAMTATPRGGTDVFTLDDDDFAHPVLGPRLRTRRFIDLRTKGTPSEVVAEFLAAGRQRVAVICNTVRRAREVFASIDHDDKALIIGRQRPLDRDRIMADLEPRLRSGAEADQPLVVVTTQCIEAGADFDFDAMVTDPCPLDALRQRIGRLDRLGNLGEAVCVMLGKPDKFTAPYGASPLATWKWLESVATKRRVDLGFAGWQALRDQAPEDCRSARPDEVSLLEPHMRMLARTSPRPRVEPDVDLLLHGHRATPGAISIVWRDHVDSSLLDILPPSALEACEVPLKEVHAWLGGIELEADAGDIEGAELANGIEAPATEVLRWLGRNEEAMPIRADELRPGDMIIVPTSAGGYDRFGWAPRSAEPVPDLAAEAFEVRTERQVEIIEIDEEEEAPSRDGRTRLHRWTGGFVIEHLGDDAGSQIEVPEITLETHQHAVADRARADAEALGLDGETMHFVGLHHDDGKDSDWQLHVNGDDPSRLATPLAKGPYRPSQLARLPRGWRHEWESFRRLPDDTSDLARWLIATHHGHARPLWPIADHGIGLAELMDAMHREHGFWRTAHLEAVFRLADRAVSKDEVDNAT